MASSPGVKRESKFLFEERYKMPAHVLYQIPMATGPIRLIIGGFCLLVVLAIYGSWLPRVTRWLLGLPRKSAARTVAFMALALIPVAVGLAPLVVLMALIRNPMAYVSDTGVVKESVFSQTPVSFTWGEIAHVSCGPGRGAGPRWFTLFATDGRKIGLGNPGGFDFASLHVLFEDRLGPAAMQGCPKAVRRSISGRASPISDWT
jgi:hypothetical protein